MLYNGDFRDVIEEVKKNNPIIITDPPYNIGFKYNEYKDCKEERDYIAMLSELRGMRVVIIHYPEETMRYVVPALGIPEECLAWCYNANIDRRFRLINFYNIRPDFKKVRQPYKNPTDKRISERISNGAEGSRLYDWFDDIQLVKNVSKEKTIHPCPIPEKLIERLITLVSDEGEHVFDPFMGCGTVPAVAKRMNRIGGGAEINTEYFHVAEQRMNTIPSKLETYL